MSFLEKHHLLGITSTFSNVQYALIVSLKTNSFNINNGPIILAHLDELDRGHICFSLRLTAYV